MGYSFIHCFSENVSICYKGFLIRETIVVLMQPATTIFLSDASPLVHIIYACEGNGIFSSVAEISLGNPCRYES